ncbi:stomatin family protein [Calocera viscosa TUFC12733]|uniref:Stomatin family protein n=1 Tax=Calocera viscosa (strain TUFC12733) TaxID=1330018 RepID=A0A167NSH7_CALVF|nr:stomatin family protein [Calocera viscosa TUFC12733]
MLIQKATTLALQTGSRRATLAPAAALMNRALLARSTRDQRRSFITIVPQGHEGYRLTLGRNPTKLIPGLHLNIPLLHTLQLVDTRETSIPIADLNGFTSDNVPVLVSGSLFFRVKDAYHACYSVNNFGENVRAIGTSAMRSVVGSFHYDAIIGDRNAINDKLRAVIGRTIESWGIECTRFEIQTFKPSNREVERQLELQMEAERNRRKQLLDTQAAVNVAEGMKQKTILQSEGEMQGRINQADGEFQARLKEAEGFGRQIEMIAQAIAGHGALVESEARVRAVDFITEVRRQDTFRTIAHGQGNNTYFLPGDATGLSQPYEMDATQRWVRTMQDKRKFDQAAAPAQAAAQ